MINYRYSRWDGTQNPFNFDEDDIMEALSDDIIAHGDVNRALRNLFRQGMPDDQGQRVDGLRQLRERLQQQKQQQLERYNLESLMDDIQERLQDVIDTERKGIEDRLRDAREQLEHAGDDSEFLQAPMKILEGRAQQATEKLDNLPESSAGQIKELGNHEFMDPEAQQKFQELLDSLKQQMMQNFFQGMKDAIQSMSPEEMQRMQEMIQALNQMLNDRAIGDDPDFEGFMEQYGQFFDPNRPSSLDELIEMLQQQMASMQSLMDSMSSDMRSEL